MAGGKANKLKKNGVAIVITSVHQHKVIQKDQWGNDIEFLLSCITLSVGLGNVWRYNHDQFMHIQ